jgi:predicted amidophosphoribosyltransferase
MSTKKTKCKFCGKPTTEPFQTCPTCLEELKDDHIKGEEVQSEDWAELL